MTMSVFTCLLRTVLQWYNSMNPTRRTLPRLGAYLTSGLLVLSKTGVLTPLDSSASCFMMSGEE